MNINAVDEFRNYPNFFRYIQMDHTWIANFIYENPEVIKLVKQIDYYIDEEASSITIKFHTNKWRVFEEFLVLLENNGYESRYYCYHLPDEDRVDLTITLPKGLSEKNEHE